MVNISTRRLMIAVLLMTAQLEFINADNQISPKPNNTQSTKLDKINPSTPSRPRVPSNQAIHIIYDMGTQECYFGLPEGVEFVSVEVLEESTGFTFYGEAYASEPICIIPMTAGFYTIVCTTEDGSVFSGTMSI